MGKKTKKTVQSSIPKPDKKTPTSSSKVSKPWQEDYLYAMHMAPRINKGSHWFCMLPATFFTAIIIMIVRLYQYERPMAQFYWTTIDDTLVDFFCYYKLFAILACTITVFVILSYIVFSQLFYVKRSPYYIPMIIYSAFVLISYFLSDYKEFAFWGWNDRFEGTVTLLAYMLMLFYIINTVNDEKNVKWIIYPTAVSSFLLSLIGISQALDHDFFRTTFGKKLITPSWFWDYLDTISFTFQNKEIYQTVYNINYVSFYLTLLIPLFGLLFIHSVMNGKQEPLYKKILWGVLFALNMYNLIGSQSSGGFLGMGVVVLVAIIMLNKTILKWWRPILVLLVITALIGGLTYERWMPELTGAATSVLGTKNTSIQEVSENSEDNSKEATATNTTGHLDYIETKGNDILISYNGNKITFTTYPENPLAIKLTDGMGKDIDFTQDITNPSFRLINGTIPSFVINDERFNSFIFGSAPDEAGNNYLLIKIDDYEWLFSIVEGVGVRYRNDGGKSVALKNVPSIGWENNLNFGSGRGYIWSRTLPMMKETIVRGYGADTYCIYFPHNDYVGKYHAGWDVNIIVDKPHNMYMGAWIGTGGISVLALLVLWFMYIAQSIKLFWRKKICSFTEYAGIGIFFGICGFLVSGFVDDSSISVMPMFYGLLGTGIAINIMLKKEQATKK